jgi:hypothetical protein
MFSRDFRYTKWYKKIFTVSVDNLAAYKKLPRSEREVLGFWYKTPTSYLLGGGNFHKYWDQFYKTQHRIREFFVDCEIWLSVKKRIIGEWFTKVFNPKNQWARKSIPKLWAEYDSIMEDILFNGLVDYVDSGSFDTTDWDYDEHYSNLRDRIMGVYNFAKEDLPKRKKEEEDLLSKIFSDPESKKKDFKERWYDTLEYGLTPLVGEKKKMFTLLHLKEEETRDLVTKNLKEIIELRGCLW